MSYQQAPIVSTLRFCNESLPAPRRLGALRDLFDRAVQLEIETNSTRAVEMAMYRAPGIRRAHMLSALTARMARPASMLADGEDTVCLMIKSAGHLAVAQRGHECRPEVGDGALLVYREPARLAFEDAKYLSIRVPYTALSPMVDAAAAAARLIPRSNAALNLLRTYVEQLPDHINDPNLARLTATHVHDLMALAIGATRDGREIAAHRSLRTARLKSMQAELRRDNTLSVGDLARRHRVTARYVQMLFEEAGTTHTAFTRDLKLEAARRLLLNPLADHMSVASIAYESGFADVSHFNRSFKGRFGMTPGDVRASRRDET